MKTSVKLLIGVVAGAAAGGIATTLPATLEAARDHTGAAVAAVALTLALQVVRLTLPRVGSTGFASLGLVLTAIALGAGPALAVGVLAGVAHWVRTRGLLHRALFDCGNFALAAGGAAVVYEALGAAATTPVGEFLAGTAAAAAYVGINHALLCVAMSLSEGRAPRAVWRERFGWVPVYLVFFAPVGGVLTLGGAEVGAALVVALVFSLMLLVLLRRDLRAHQAVRA